MVAAVARRVTQKNREVTLLLRLLLHCHLYKCQGVVKKATNVSGVLPELALMANTILDSCKAKMGTVGGFKRCVAIMALWS